MRSKIMELKVVEGKYLNLAEFLGFNKLENKAQIEGVIKLLRGFAELHWRNIERDKIKRGVRGGLRIKRFSPEQDKQILLDWDTTPRDKRFSFMMKKYNLNAKQSVYNLVARARHRKEER